jgi:NADPH:quinone reductase-like Zn-dependent oxidoreductase/acyl carrier protein
VLASMAVADATARGSSVEDLEFLRPLPLSKGALLRLQLDERDGNLNIHSRHVETEPAEWHPTATARIPTSGPASCRKQMSIEEIRSRCSQSTPPGEIYDALAAAGIEYGPRFRVIREAWRGDGEVLGRLECHESVAPECGRYGIHPTLLDGAFQLMAAAMQPGTRTGTAVLPSFVSRITVHRTPGTHCWVYGRCTRHSGSLMESDLVLCDQTGNVLVDVSRFRCQVFARDGSASGQESQKPIYDYKWTPAAIEPPIVDTSQRWLVFADDAALADELQTLIRAGDQNWIRVQRAPQYSMMDGIYYVNARNVGDLERAISHAQQQAPIAGVCYLWALDSPFRPGTGPAPGSAPSANDALELLCVIQALSKTAGLQLRKLCIVTRSLHACNGEAMPPNLGQASVWGLGRVIASERPDLHSVLVDVDAEPAAPTVAALSCELLGKNAENEIALRNGQRFVPRVSALKPENLYMEVGAGEKPFALEIGSPGILDTLRYRLISRRPPGPGEAEVEVEAAGINFKDLMKAMKLLPPSYLEETFTGTELGMECSGRVVALGPDVSSVKIGDEVVVIGNNGGFCSHNTVSTAYMAHKPLSFEESPCLISYVTPYYGFRYVAKLEKGESVLIHCATGGVGLAAVRLAQWIGATVFATAGTEEKRQYLRSMGIQHVMDSRSLHFADEILEKTKNRGVDVVLNCLSGEALRKSIAVLAPYGRFLEIGKRDIVEGGKLPLQRFDNNLMFAAIDTDRMGAERPALFRRLIDEVCQLLKEKVLPPLPITTFAAAEVADAFRYMARSKHIGKLIVQMRKGRIPVQGSASESLRIRDDGTYLITGGLGGVGMIAARWLAKKGVRHLVLAGRHGAATPEMQANVQQLEREGVKVSLPRVDFSVRAEVARLFHTIQQTLPPLRGIIHAAAVLDDAPLSQLTPERFQAVWRSKAEAAWYLHECSRGLDLDFFVMFSSVSALIGNVGQGSYVAANCFLDALAWYRRACGLPAVSLAWGAINAGVVARNPALLNYFQELGIRAFTHEECAELLEHALNQQPAYAAILDIDWPRWATAQPSIAARPRFSRVISAGRQAEIDPRLACLLESPSGEQQKLIEEFLCDDLSKVIHLPASKIDVQLTLENLGLDSLMMVELTTAMNMRWGLDLSSIQNMYAHTISDIASELLASIIKRHSAHPAEIYDQDAIDKLSEQEIDALLLQMTQQPARGKQLSMGASNG